MKIKLLPSPGPHQFLQPHTLASVGIGDRAAPEQAEPWLSYPVMVLLSGLILEDLSV